MTGAALPGQDQFTEAHTAVGATLTEIWDRLQRLQTDFCISQELPAYYTCPQWEKARTVLDVGTGNGYYLRKITGRFPEKVYCGIDISKEFIDIARKDGREDAIQFLHGDLFDATGRYDFVIMRLLLQHLPDITKALGKVAEIINANGSALIIDAHDPVRFYRPDVPEFRRFFEAYAEIEAQQGRDRAVASRLGELIKACPGWKLGRTIQLLIPSTIPGNMDLFRETYALVIDLAENQGKFQYDFANVKEAWHRWCELDGAYTQVGLSIVRIDRV